MAIDFQPTAYVRMVNGIVDINATTVTAIRCGSENLAGRKWLMIQVAVGSTTKVFIGSSSAAGTEAGTAITKAELAKYGQKFGDGDRVWLPVGDQITVYAITSSGGGRRLRVAELA